MGSVLEIALHEANPGSTLWHPSFLSSSRSLNRARSLHSKPQSVALKQIKDLNSYYLKLWTSNLISQILNLFTCKMLMTTCPGSMHCLLINILSSLKGKGKEWFISYFSENYIICRTFKRPLEQKYLPLKTIYTINLNNCYRGTLPS